MSVSRRCSCYAKPASMEHAMQFLARLVWAMLGATAITTKKLERGLSLVVLGVKLSLCAFGCACRPAEAKAQKCIDAICKALKEEMLHPGAAQKLARRLSWAAQFMFFMLGRAMLRPIFRQQCEVWLHQRCLEGGFAMVVLWRCSVLNTQCCGRAPMVGAEGTASSLFCECSQHSRQVCGISVCKRALRLHGWAAI